MNILFLILILVLKVLISDINSFIITSIGTLINTIKNIDSELAHCNYLKWNKILNTDYYYFYRTVMMKT